MLYTNNINKIIRMDVKKMKIEKINDNQIRCTLSASDLESRELKLSELAYGTEKAKNLFHDMIEQADREFGFQANEMPLMIEAIPVSTDCIILVITRVDNPEELDEKFASFAPPKGDYSDDTDDNSPFKGLSDELTSYMDKIVKSAQPDFIPMSETLSTSKKDEGKDEAKLPNVTTAKTFLFNSWDTASDAAKKCMIVSPISITSKLFKNSDSEYILYISGDTDNYEHYRQICTILSEYGEPRKTNYAILSYLNEHSRILVKDNALNILSQY